jgi:hypothetical protein
LLLTILDLATVTEAMALVIIILPLNISYTWQNFKAKVFTDIPMAAKQSYGQNIG